MKRPGKARTQSPAGARESSVRREMWSVEFSSDA